MKRLQVVFSDEAWALVESSTTEANEGFDVGNINYSDVVNEMVLNSKVDVKSLQIKHTDVKRSLKQIANQKDIDLDQVIKALTELKGKISKKKHFSKPEVTHV